MNKLYHFEITASDGVTIEVSKEYATIEQCVENCKYACEWHDVDYNDEKLVKLYFTEDFGETYTECTEEGEIAG